MNRIRRILAFACAAAPGLVAGCVERPATTWMKPSAGTTKYTVEDAERFVPLDEYSYDTVTCTGLQEKVQPDGRLKVVADVKNRAGEAIAVQVRCVFDDGTGAMMRGETPWTTVGLAANATEAVAFVATDPGFRSYVIRVRRAR